VRSRKVFLSLGSNLGDRLASLAKAVELLRGPLEQVRVSSVYETAPLYLTDQPRFLNIVVSGRTRLPPDALLQAAQAIEGELGRRRAGSVPKGPRPIDIDILLYGRQVIRQPDLVVPHPGLGERRFVLEPLLELEPGLHDPQGGAALARALENLPPQGVDRVGTWEYTLSLPGHDHGSPRREAEL
jgi:2-amino-4-hydroxy-6-hydroxymethyldihydropteridine diphosphokinase